jgi:hypothetical protein
MDPRNTLADVSRPATPKQLTKPDNALHFLHDNCAAIAELRTRIRIAADSIVGVRPLGESATDEIRAITVLSRIEQFAKVRAVPSRGARRFRGGD